MRRQVDLDLNACKQRQIEIGCDECTTYACIHQTTSAYGACVAGQPDGYVSGTSLAPSVFHERHLRIELQPVCPWLVPLRDDQDIDWRVIRDPHAYASKQVVAGLVRSLTMLPHDQQLHPIPNDFR